jgi:hypothetical protein
VNAVPCDELTETGAVHPSRQWTALKLIASLKWCYQKMGWLMHPEIAHYVIQTAQELADLLGISLAQVRE